MGQAKKDPSKAAEAEAIKAQVKKNADRLCGSLKRLRSSTPHASAPSCSTFPI